MSLDKKEKLLSALEIFEGQLLYYATRITGNVEISREIVQDVFLKLWNQGSQHVYSHLPQWLFTVCRNLAIDKLRKEKHMVEFNTKTERINQQVSTSKTPSQIAEQNEDNSLLIKCIEILPEKNQELLRLKFQHGFSYKEIAKITGLSVTNVGFILHHSVQILRQNMAKLGEKEATKGGAL